MIAAGKLGSEMKLIRMAALTIGACVASAATAQAIEDKLCIFEAAKSMPAVPGLVVISSSAKPADKAKTAADISNRIYSVDGALAMARKFEILSGKLTGQLRDTFDEDKRASILAAAIADGLSEARDVEIEVSAAGQKATFGSVCGISKSGAVVTAAKGIIR